VGKKFSNLPTKSEKNAFNLIFGGFNR